MSFMNRLLVSTLFLLVTTSAVCFAGTLEGKVSSGDSVVYIDAIPGKTFPAPTQSAVISQRTLKFVPHILVVQLGTTVEFQNDDSVQHNLFWPSIGGNKKAAHNLGTWARGEKRSYKFEYAGVVPLYCNVHPQMSGFIVVSPTPYFAQTDSSGNFKIENVPDGKYTAVAWHEGEKPQSKKVAIAGTGRVDFSFPASNAR
jgi:plastocyanin